MELIDQSAELMFDVDGDLLISQIEAVARTCYQSEDKIDTGTAAKLVARLRDSGHHAMLEFGSLTFRLITDRGVTHELVRHRIASYAQESTRYCNYGKLGIKFVIPVDFILDEYDRALLNQIEDHYDFDISRGRTPQQARYFLPNGLKTEIIVQMNFRELLHFFELRIDKAAHPQMRALANDMLYLCKEKIPVVFDNLELGG